jgi:hypothetical protein
MIVLGLFVPVIVLDFFSTDVDENLCKAGCNQCYHRT